MLSVSVIAVAGGLVLTPSMPVQMRRGCSVVMQQGPGYKSTGPQGVSAKYSSNGMNTADPQEPTSLRPENPDLAAAAASKEGIEGKPLAAPPVPIVDQLFVGSGVLAGDVGFDPLQLADTSKALAWYREAEIKHCRLAMLAAVGWPVAEKLNGPISAALGLDSLLVDGKSPTLANGGLGSVSVIYWLAALGLAVAAETSYLDDQLGVRRVSDYEPGMLKFDPLGMDGKGTRNAEVWLGRVAQLAVVGYALEEFVTKKPIALGF